MMLGVSARSTIGERISRAAGVLELVVSLLIALVSPFAFVFLLVTHAKWVIALGALSTAAHALWCARFEGWGERSAGEPMGAGRRVMLTLLVLCLNTLFWGLVLSSIVPRTWVSSFNVSAPAWLSDHDWLRWAEPLSASVEAFVAGALVELLAYVLALLPFVLVVAVAALLMIRLGAGRARDRVMFTFYVLFVAGSACLLCYLLFGSSLAWLFWGINGYILWKGGAWLTLFSVFVVGSIPFRIMTLLRNGSWLRAFFR